MDIMRLLRSLKICLLLTLFSGNGQAAYEPLSVKSDFEPQVVDLEFKYNQRQVLLRVYLPGTAAAQPVVLFSHGLGGSRLNNAFLGRHWAARGYVAVFVQHPGSDSSVWQGKPVKERLAEMQAAANAANYLLRVQDIPAVLNQLERWNKVEGHALAGRMNLDRIGMSGHSFGAQTTQALSGQSSPRGRDLFKDPRIKAAVIMSPSSPRRGNPTAAFGKVSLPWLLMTGTHDVALIGGVYLESRLAVFPALPAGSKYELVLYDAEHSAFTDRPLPGDRIERNPNHHRVILALSTAFWDAYLQDDAAARVWLDGDGVRSVLQEKDSWRKK